MYSGNSLALNEQDLPPKTREQLEKTGVSAKHLLSLINDILDMTRMGKGVPHGGVKKDRTSFFENLIRSFA